MTNTKRSMSLDERFECSANQAYAGSPYTHPQLVSGALKEVVGEPILREVSDSYRTTLGELIEQGLVEVVMSTRGGRGGYVQRVRLTELGRDVKARARRAELLALSGLL